MQILETVNVEFEFKDLLGRVSHPEPVPTPRSSGYHVSGILRAVALKSGILVPLAKADSAQQVVTGVGSTSKAGELDVDDDEMPLRMALGMASEHWIVGMYPDMVWQPGEQQDDNIYGSIDGLSVGPASTDMNRVEEFKLTWKSCRRPFNSNWLWLRQGMAYCHLWDTDLCRFHIIYVNGNYRPPAPIYIRYLVRFSPAEIKGCWGLLKRNKHLAEKE